MRLRWVVFVTCLPLLMPGAATADHSWSCDVEGRILGGPGGTCSHELDATSPWYRLQLVNLGLDSSGDIKLRIEERGEEADGYLTGFCRILLGRGSCAFSGTIPARWLEPGSSGWGIYFWTPHPASFVMELEPTYCETGTCTDAYEIATSGFHLRIDEVEQPL